MADRKKSEPPKVTADDMYVPPGMDVLSRLLEDVKHGVAPAEKPPSYSPRGVAIRDFTPGQPLKQGRIIGPKPKPIWKDQTDG